MKTFISTLILSLFGLCAFGQSANSYGAMQSRFEKKKLDPNDSAAFIQSGLQKARTLFEYNDVHLQNTLNRSNQIYVEQKVPQLFYVAEGDSVDIDLIMSQAQAIVQAQMGKPVELAFREKEGVLGEVYTTETQPAFKADLVLIQVPKQFGKKKKMVWQVFLANPTFQD